MYKRQGLSLIELLVVTAIVAVLAAIAVVSVQKVRASAARTQCQNNIRQVGLALLQYHDGNKRFPAGTGSEADQYPYLNWQARILPFADQGPLWDKIHRAFKSQPNFLAQDQSSRSIPLAIFICPAGGRATSNGDPASPAVTYYLGVLGSDSIACDGMLYIDSAIKSADVRDGAANTLFVGERPPSPDGGYGWWFAGWGQNKDGAMEAVLGVRELNRPWPGNGQQIDASCAAGPYDFKSGRVSNHCDIFHFWSLHSSGAHFLFVDGSVRFLSYSSNPILPALATRAGGEPSVSLPD